jgi:hypothetical protein
MTLADSTRAVLAVYPEAAVEWPGRVGSVCGVEASCHGCLQKPHGLVPPAVFTRGEIPPSYERPLTSHPQAKVTEAGSRTVILWA